MHVGDIGPRRRSPVLEDAKDDLAVEISKRMQSQKLRLCDLTKFGISKRRLREVSLYLRGEPGCRIGPVGALDLAEKLGIPVRILVGDEAREAA